MSDDSIFIGTHAFSKEEGEDRKAQRVYLKDEARKKHTHIIGGTGTGKSKLMEQMIQEDIKNGKGVCLIDPHGSLYDSVLKWCILEDYRQKLIIIDPNKKEWSVGLNFLEYDTSIWDLGQHVENIIDGLGKARDEDLFATAQVVIWLRNFLQLAAAQNEPKLTFTDLYTLIRDDKKILRDVLTDKISDSLLRRFLKDAWHEYDNAPGRTRADMMRLPVWSRIQTFLGTQNMRRIVGQAETSVDFYDAMQNDKIVLVNLSGQLTENERSLLGVMIIEKIYEAALKRKPDVENQYYVYIDEFGYFVSERIAKALEELRKRHVGFILAHQELEQLRDEGRIGGQRLLASIMTNAKIKIAFRVSRADAEAMMYEMFAGFITGDEIKHEQKVISFWPHKTREKSYAYGSSVSHGEAQSISNMIGQMSGQISGQVFIPGSGFISSVDPVSTSIGKNLMNSLSRGDSRTSIHGYSDSEVEIDVPFYDLEPFEQIVSTTFYSIEEIKERYISFLQNQQERFFHLRILGETARMPIPLRTPNVRHEDISPKVLREQVEDIVKQYCRKGEEVERLCSERIDLLESLNKSEVEKVDPSYNQDEYE